MNIFLDIYTFKKVLNYKSIENKSKIVLYLIT